MTKSAKGNTDNPGTNVKQKSGLNKSILDQGWYLLMTMVSYKQAWRNGMLLKINPKNTSRECAKCHYIDKANRKSQSVFECVSCGYKANADNNASEIILAAGHAVLITSKYLNNNDQKSVIYDLSIYEKKYIR